MAHRPAHITAVTVMLLVLYVTPASAWDKEEHRVLADSVFEAVMLECGPSVDSAGFTRTRPELSATDVRSAWGGATFGDRTAFLAADDFASERIHKRGKTILEQLASTATGPAASGMKPDNVVAAFLTEHLQALRLAAGAPGSNADLKGFLLSSLEQEAKAQGYLADAFSAGHILSYREGIFTWLARRNRMEAHDYHRDRGVYVIDGRGDVWQTFGDGLLHWYPPTYHAVFEACSTSLKEVLLVFYVSHGLYVPESLSTWIRGIEPDKTPETLTAGWLSNHSGPEYYSDVRLPSLMRLPIPVAAAWSFRTDSLDQHSVRVRHNYPQLRETGLHDPDAGDLDSHFLYRRASVPTWMVPEPLRDASPADAYDLIRSDPNWASVRYTQDRTAPPSYKGLLVLMGGQVTVRDGQSRLGGSLGVGYGILDDLFLVKNISVATTFMPSFHEANDRLLTLTAGLDVDLPGNGWPHAIRLEGGGAFGWGGNLDDFGPVFALGLDSKVIPLGFTYAGMSWRLQYQWYSLDRPVSGPALIMILQ